MPRPATLVLAAALTLACSKSSPPAAAPLAPPPPACTAETALAPGVPGSPGHLIPSDVNPNGVSELAQRMRGMLQDLERLRPKVVAGEAARIDAGEHRRIRCSWPTVPSDRNARFDGWATSYLYAVDDFNRSDPPQRDAFNAVVEACLHCHRSSCRGAMAAIAPLRILRPGEEPAPAAAADHQCND